ncbi:MarR family winged helix-turn-helix transcriptional regulator [Actinomadura sp. GTD37]|uniref:MarR family winged helix-turn-helix transcriptional regulator n=1 Tax=Actinomadura sp. GTD37 TaxID=1778030 RepID=UPI0035C12E69
MSPAVPHGPAEAGTAEIERALSRVAHMLTRARQHDRTVAAAGVPVERAAVPVLRALADGGGPMRPGELAARLAVEAPHVTRQVQRLERAGYVERVPDPADGRCRRIGLSESGRAAVESIRAAGRNWIADALAGWTPADRERLAGLVHRMVDDFAAHSDGFAARTGPAGAGGAGAAEPGDARSGRD